MPDQPVIQTVGLPAPNGREENGDILLFWGEKRGRPFGEDGW